MNANLRNAIRNLAASQGTAVLLDVRRVEEHLPVFAGKEANAERKLFIAALASGLPAELQKCPDQGARLECKKRIARKLVAGQGFPVPLVKEVFDLIEELLYAAVSGQGSALPCPPAARGSWAAKKPVRGKKIIIGIAAAAALIFGGVLLARNIVDAKTLFERGKELYGSGNYKNAIAIMNRVIKKDPAFVEAYFYRGLSFLGSGDYDNAIIDFNHTAGNSRDYNLVYYYRSYAFMQKGLYDSARRDAKTFAECQPGNYLAYWLMGDCYFNLTDYRNAIGEYTRAIAIEPDPVVYTTRGRAYLLAEEFNLAINDFTRVLETDPANAEVGELLALAREGKESEGAEEDFLQNVMATILSGGLEALTDLDDNWVMEMMLGALLGGL